MRITHENFTMKKQILLVLFLSLLSYGNAQVKNDVIRDNEIKKLKLIQTKYRDFESKLEREIYDEYFLDVEKKITKGYNENYISTDKEYNQLVKELFHNFKKQNPTYHFNEANAYVINDNTPNAFTTGFDYFFVNTGMFNLIDNEYQLAAVIGHELAHNYLKHSRESILQHAEFTKDFQKKMKSVKQSEMIKLIQSQDEVIQKKYDLATQSRKKEIAADSLGFVFYSNLNYPKEEYLNLLNKLKTLDQEVFYTIKEETYRQIF
jgi:Putative Zn-dependent protease, contains TPR repeats